MLTLHLDGSYFTRCLSPAEPSLATHVVLDQALCLLVPLRGPSSVDTSGRQDLFTCLPKLDGLHGQTFLTHNLVCGSRTWRSRHARPVADDNASSATATPPLFLPSVRPFEWVSGRSSRASPPGSVVHGCPRGVPLSLPWSQTIRRARPTRVLLSLVVLTGCGLTVLADSVKAADNFARAPRPPELEDSAAFLGRVSMYLSVPRHSAAKPLSFPNLSGRYAHPLSLPITLLAPACPTLSICSAS